MVITVGISFNLIIIRVDQGIAVGETTYVNTQPSIPLQFRSQQRQQDSSGKNLEVMVSSEVEHDREFSGYGKETVSVGSTGLNSKPRWDVV